MTPARRPAAGALQDGPAAAPPPRQGTGQRLLVVDDDAVDRTAVRRTLRQTAFADATVVEATTADEALAALGDGRSAGFDCVLLDYELAGTTGLQVLQRMAQRGSRVPVVMLTGRGDPETAAALIKGGASDFLSKDGLTPARLEQSVRGAVQMARTQRELQASRERLAITLRSIADAVLVLDERGRVTYLNPAAARLTGWPPEEASGRRLEEVAFVVAADDARTPGGAKEGLQGTLLHERTRAVLEGEAATERSDMTLVARDGTQLYVDATVSALRDDDGATTGAVVALRDITARKAAEAELAAANRSLQALASTLEAQTETLEQQATELEQQFEEAQAVASELERTNQRLLEAHESTERSEARYRALIEATTQLVWTADPQGRARELSGWTELTGQSMEQLRGDGWLEVIHPDDRAQTQEAWRAAIATGRGFEVEYRLRVRDGSDRWFRVRSVPVRDAEGNVREWVGTLADVDEERRAEDARREEADLVETLHRIGGVLSQELDVERLVQTVTDAATALTGAQFGAFFYTVVDKQGEKLTLYTLSGAPRSAFADFGHPRATPVFAPTFHGDGIVRSDDITQDPRYGQMAPHHGMPPRHLPVRSYLAVPVISRSGEVIGGLFFGHAAPGVFTERAERLASGIAASAAVAMDNARLYDAERRARAEAEHANKAKSEFLANMSHELRTPLNAIGGYAELVEMGIRGPVTEAQRADLERIKRSQRHLLSLINDILNFAKIEAGRVRFAPRVIAMQSALGDLEALVAPQLRAKGLRYEQALCDDSYMAYVDPERLQQILLNLLSNAVKFTPEGGAIEVRCDATAEQIILAVRDTGIGIPPDKLEHIFEPFVQLERGQTAQSAGTGLGLAISRELARAMNGDLRAESTPEQGSTFYLTIPRHSPQPAAG